MQLPDTTPTPPKPDPASPTYHEEVVADLAGNLWDWLIDKGGASPIEIAQTPGLTKSQTKMLKSHMDDVLTLWVDRECLQEQAEALNE